MKRLKRIFQLILCILMVFSVSLDSIKIFAEVTIQPGEAWNTYLSRVYQERYNEYLEMQKVNKDNNVPAEEVWTGNAVQPTEDADGDGLLDVYTAAQFRWALVNKKSMELMNDIDLGGRNKVNWSPVADPGGITIEGNGYTVYNLYINRNGTYTGLIAATGNTSGGRNPDSKFLMQNIRFRYAYVYSGGQQYTGAVVGFMGQGKLFQVSLEDSVVHGGAHTGGIFTAWSSTTGIEASSTEATRYRTIVDQCHVRNVTVYGTSCVGSFAGPLSGTKVTNSYSIDSYDISTATHSGGFVSCPGWCWVENCFTNVKLYCNSDGGVFAGICHLGNTFKNCFSAGVVEGTSNVGGFFGRSEADLDSFINCYSTSMVGMQNTASNMGGFYGSNSGTAAALAITNCYAAGEVGTTQTVSKPGKNSTIAGVGGATVGTFNNSYYDKQTTGMREYAVGNTLHKDLNGVTGYLTGQMIGDAMKGKFGETDWVYTDAMYPQLAVFANPDESFGNETDRAIARAYSAASVCTALLQPSNLNKTQDELAEFSTTDYDTVRDITVLFPLTNNELAGYKPDKGLDITWATREGYTCQVKGDMYGMDVITIDSKTYETMNFTPGVGWVDVSVNTGIKNPQNGENIIGKRFMRLVPTTVISVGDAKSNSGVVYVPSDNRIDENDTIYDHRKNVTFAVGEASNVDSGNIKNSGYPLNDTTFGYEVDENGAVKTVGVDLPSELGGKIVVVVSKFNEETGKYEPRDIATDKSLQELLLAQRHPTDDDLGVYRLEYRWFTSGNLAGGYITNSKTLTVRYALNLSFEWNHPDHIEDNLIFKDDYPYVIGETVKDVNHSLPKSPETIGYTFCGWSTDPNADPDNFVRFNENTGLKDDTVVHAIWKINTYDVTIVKNGRGYITGTGKYDYKETAKVTWEPEENWYVNYVMVDGVIRDDLLNKNEYVFENVDKDHTVYVEFTQDKNANNKDEYYQVTTTKTGGDETCIISNSVSVKAGENAEVTWSAGDEYEIKKILVDGIVVEANQLSEYVFNAVSKNHNVEVVFEKKAQKNTIHVSESYSTISTSKRGDGSITTSSSVKNGDSYSVEWSANAGSHVEKVLIDGIECTDENILNANQITFDAVDGDHTIEVIFEKDTPEPVDPDVTKDIYKIDTLITGGPGSISPSKTVEVKTDSTGSESVSYTVDWTTPDQRYKVQNIYVDGESVEANSQVVFDNIDRDHKVTVVLEPNLFEVKTVVEGNGSITQGATVFWGENYTVEYQAADGWKLQQIYRDGDALIEYPEENEPEEEVQNDDSEIETYSLENDENEVELFSMENTDELENDEASMISLMNLNEEENDILPLANDDSQDVGPIEFNAIENDHVVHVVFVRADVDPDEPIDETIKHTVSTSLSGGIGNVTPGAVLDDGSGYTVSWDIAEGYEVESVEVKVNGISKEGLVTDNKVVLENLGDDIEVNVKLRPSKTVNIDGSKPDDVNKPLHNIYTSIEKGAGTISSSLIGVQEGSNQTVTWTFGNDSAIRTIYVDGVIRDDLLSTGQLLFENITQDHRVEIFMKENPNGTEGTVDKDTYRVLTSISGNGTISDSSSVAKGENAHVDWSPAAGYEVSKVLIDGVERENLKNANGIDFNNIGTNHTVHVEFKKIGSSEDDPDDKVNKYSILTSMEGNGTISPSSVVSEGENKTVTWEAKGDSVVSAVIVDGVIRDDLIHSNSYSFENVNSDHSIEVLFKNKKDADQIPDKDKENHIFIKTSSIGQGTISPSVGLSEGESYTVSWEAKEGWKVAGVIVDGLNADSLTEVDHITFNNASKSHTVLVVFVPTEGKQPAPSHKIETDIEGGKGTITATGEAEEGDSYTVTWEPADGYEVEKVIVDGIERPDLIIAGHLTLDFVDGEHSIKVIMRKRPNADVAAVNTGDESNLTLAVTLTVISGALLLSLILMKKKRKKS